MAEIGKPPESSQRFEIVRNERSSVLPPSKNLQATYVVPIRGEVSNGNFFLQLKDFTRQTGIAPDMYEIIYARNNKSNDIVEDNQFFKENQTILSVVKYVQGVTQSLPEELEDWQAKIAEMAKHKKIQVQTIDIPTTLLTNDDVESNIERSRVSGENFAVQRFESIGTNGAVIMMDADTRIESNTTKKIKEQLIDQPEVGLLKIAYDTIPGEGGINIFKTTAQERFLHSKSLLNNSLHGYQNAGWYAIKAESLGVNDVFRTIYARDGLRPKTGETKRATGVRIYTQDRARPEDIGGQFGHNRYETSVYSGRIRDPLDHPALSILLDLYGRTSAKTTALTQTSEILREYFSHEPWLPTLEEKIRDGALLFLDPSFEDLQRQNQVDPKIYAEAVYKIFHKLSGGSEDEFETHVHTELSRERLRHNQVITKVKRLLKKAYDQPAGSPGKETLEAHFLKQNPWIIDALQQARATYGTEDEAYMSLQGDFPEYLKTFEDTTYTYSNALVMGVTKFLDEVRRHPGNFSNLSPLLM